MLSELTASTKRLALVGLAKNTGKTEALAAMLRELEAQGRRVGVTSVGRDGEERDVIDSRIEKPRVVLAAGSLVATADSLLRASAIAHELLEETGVRTPLGRVLVARLQEAGSIEVAGPSTAADMRMVSDAMLAHGAEQVLIDGAVDRRAASSPDVSDGLVMATGAVLDRDIDEVVLQTRDAVELVRLPLLDGVPEAGRHLRDLATSMTARAAGRRSLLVADEGDPVELPARFILTVESEQIAELLDEHPDARWLLVAGALPERFLRSLLHPLRHRGRAAHARGSGSDKGLPLEKKPRLVPPSGRAPMCPRAPRAGGAHGQPRRAAVASVRFGAVPRVAGTGDRRRADLRRAGQRLSRPAGGHAGRLRTPRVRGRKRLQAGSRSSLRRSAGGVDSRPQGR